VKQLISRAGALFIGLTLSLGTATQASADDAWTEMGEAFRGAATSDLLGTAVALSSDGLTLAFSTISPSGGDQEVSIYTWSGNSWVQKGSAISGSGVTTDEFGQSISLSSDGNVVAIGNPTSEGIARRGQAQVWAWTGTAWAKRGSDFTGTQDSQLLGSSISLSADGDTVAIGSPGSDPGFGRYTQGIVQVWTWGGSAWVQQGSDVQAPAGGSSSDDFGFSLSLDNDGDTLAVAAPGIDDAWVFGWNGSAWSTQGSVINYDATSIALSGNGSVVAMRSNAGAEIYSWNGSAWNQKGTTFTVAGNYSNEGPTVALSNDGEILALASPYASPNGSLSGRVQIYEWSDSDWSQKGDDLDGATTDGVFGNSVALSANGLILAVGSFAADDPVTNAGAVFVYQWPVPATEDSIPGPQTYFSFFLPDGRECTSISPQRVQVGTFVELPGVDALCQTMEGSTVAGWAIPNQPGFTGYGSTVQPLPPGLKVRVIESQRFTLVPFEPVLQITYDANIADDDACTPANLAHASENGRIGYSWVPREDFADARTWSQAPCMPEEHELVGWNTAGDGSGQSIEIGAPLPAGWETDRANSRHLYAIWSAN